MTIAIVKCNTATRLESKVSTVQVVGKGLIDQMPNWVFGWQTDFFSVYIVPNTLSIKNIDNSVTHTHSLKFNTAPAFTSKVLRRKEKRS